jgi:uncharacterized membrane protein HdeD (DUF308 family)
MRQFLRDFSITLARLKLHQGVIVKIQQAEKVFFLFIAMNQPGYNWWIVALCGLLAIAVAGIAVLFPAITPAFLIALFAVSGLPEGLFLIVSGIRTRIEGICWWTLVVQEITGMEVATGLPRPAGAGQ